MIYNKSKIYSISILSAIYVSVFLSVFCLFPLLSFSGTMVNVFIADVVATVLIFVFSMIFRNSSVYDPYWSVIPPIIAIYLVFLYPEANLTRQLVVTVLVLFWGIRLTLNWLRGWQGLRHQDWRYTQLRRKQVKITGL